MSKNSSQSNPDSDTTSDLSTEERRTIAPDLLLESGLAWDKYKLPIMAGVALLVLGVVGSEIYESNQAKTAAAAGALLDTAKTEADYQKVIDTYPGGQAAANAYLLLGKVRADAKNYAGAAQAWQTFAEKFPQHELLPNALTGEASALEAQGKLDEARAMFQRVATSYPNSYLAPLARLDEADLLLSQRKTADARHIYEDVIASSSKSFAGQMAAQNLKMINILPPLAGSTPAGTAPVPTASATPAVTEPPASPAPSATPAAAAKLVPEPTVSASPAAIPPTAAVLPPSAAPAASPAATP